MDAAKAGMGAVPQVAFPGESDWRQFVFGPRPQRTLFRVIVWSVMTLCLFHHLLVPIQIVGSSMYPTYKNGSVNLVNRWAYTRGVPRVGDVVALESDGELLLKRIVAGPGDTVRIVQGELLVNNRSLGDEFCTAKIPWEMEAMTLGASEYFVIGDNRAASIFGKVEQRQILGKLIF